MQLTLVTIHIGMYNEVLILHHQLQVIEAIQRKRNLQRKITEFRGKASQSILLLLGIVEQRKEGNINRRSAHGCKENTQCFPSRIMI